MMTEGGCNRVGGLSLLLAVVYVRNVMVVLSPITECLCNDVKKGACVSV